MKERSAKVRSAASEPLYPRRICLLHETWRLTWDLDLDSVSLRTDVESFPVDFYLFLLFSELSTFLPHLAPLRIREEKFDGRSCS